MSGPVLMDPKEDKGNFAETLNKELYQKYFEEQIQRIVPDMKAMEAFTKGWLKAVGGDGERAWNEFLHQLKKTSTSNPAKLLASIMVKYMPDVRVSPEELRNTEVQIRNEIHGDLLFYSRARVQITRQHMLENLIDRVLRDHKAYDNTVYNGEFLAPYFMKYLEGRNRREMEEILSSLLAAVIVAKHSKLQPTFQQASHQKETKHSNVNSEEKVTQPTNRETQTKPANTKPSKEPVQTTTTHEPEKKRELSIPPLPFLVKEAPKEPDVETQHVKKESSQVEASNEREQSEMLREVVSPTEVKTEKPSPDLLKSRYFGTLFEAHLKELLTNKKVSAPKYEEALVWAREQLKTSSMEEVLRELGFGPKEVAEFMRQYELLGRLQKLFGISLGKEEFVALIASLRYEVWGDVSFTPLQSKEVASETKVKEEQFQKPQEQVKPPTEELKKEETTQEVPPQTKEETLSSETKVKSEEKKEQTLQPKEQHKETQTQVKSRERDTSRWTNEEKYRAVLTVAQIFQPETYPLENPNYMVYGMTTLELINTLFGKNFRSLEEAEQFLKSQRENDLAQWALDLLEVVKEYQVGNLTFGELKEIVDQVRNILILSKERDFINAWNSIKDRKGVDFALYIVTGNKSFNSQYLEKVVSEIKDTQSNYWSYYQSLMSYLDDETQDKLARASVLARYELLKTLVPALSQMLRHYTAYELKEDGKAHLRKMVEDDVSTLVSHLLKENFTFLPTFYQVTLPALIETSNNLNSLTTKVEVIDKYVTGLMKATKFRGFNADVADEYLLWASKKVYEIAATLAQDIRANLLGNPNVMVNGKEVRSVESLSNYFLRKAEAIGYLSSRERRTPEYYLNTVDNIRRVAYGEVTPWNQDIFDVEKAADVALGSDKPLSPEVTAYNPQLIVKGLASNTAPLLDFIPTKHVYYGNTWMSFSAEGEVLSYHGTEENKTTGTVVARLVGTTSLVEGRIGADGKGPSLSLVAKDLQNVPLVRSLDGTIKWDSEGFEARVSGELADELNKTNGNVAIVFDQRGSQKEISIYYKDPNGNWYRVGRLSGEMADQWIAQMSTYVPGFAKIFADLRLSDKEGAIGIIGLDMGQFSVGVDFSKDEFNAIAAYLLKPLTTSIETLTGNKNIPELTYAGYVKGTLIAGGQATLGENSFVAGDLALGNVRGFRMVYETERVSLMGLAFEGENNSGLAGQAVALLGGATAIAQYAALNDNRTLAIKIDNLGGFFNTLQFIQQYRTLQHAREEYARASHTAAQIYDDLLNNYYDGDEASLRAALRDPSTVEDKTVKEKLIQLQTALRTQTAYAFLINATNYWSVLAEGKWGYAEVIRSSFGKDSFTLLNLSISLDEHNRVKVGVGGGSAGYYYGASYTYSALEFQAHALVYTMLLNGVKETALRAVLRKRLEEGELTGILGATLRELIDRGVYLNNYYLGFAYSQNKWSMQVLGTYETSTMGDTASLGLKGKYLLGINAFGLPVYATGQFAYAWGANTGSYMGLGLENDRFALNLFRSSYQDVTGRYNEGWGIKASLRFTF